MSTLKMEKQNKNYWTGVSSKQPSEMRNNGELIAEQKASASVEDIVEEMLVSGKLAEIARIRNASSAKSAEEAIETATKLPTLIDNVDIKEAQNLANKLSEKLKAYFEEEEYIQNLTENLKQAEAQTAENS